MLSNVIISGRIRSQSMVVLSNALESAGNQVRRLNTVRVEGKIERKKERPSWVRTSPIKYQGSVNFQTFLSALFPSLSKNIYKKDMMILMKNK